MNDKDGTRGATASPLPPSADSAAELAALRARLREVEAALGFPARPGQPAPPPLPALLRRVTALERRAGIVPGLDPLPSFDRTAPRNDSAPAPAGARTRRQHWIEWSQAALAAVLVIAACVWLLRPVPPRAQAGQAGMGTAPTAPVVFSPVQAANGEGHDEIPGGMWNIQLPIEGAPAFVPDQFTYREDHRADDQVKDDRLPVYRRGTRAPCWQSVDQC